ncbi:hypothetical protein [Xanthomonas sp. LF06-19]|uniref:hypothetical protein n=1 Tax=Xanthomonas sp. LF06-19 TaxID=3097551 RepID=UPI0025E5C894|nr:hypothetical protein [Xanthomonas sp. LF06-19]MDY4282637.1 hypothetical protein [Xanthomonas sp. LF06-19]
MGEAAAVAPADTATAARAQPEGVPPGNGAPRWLVRSGVVLAFAIVAPLLGTLVVGLPLAFSWTWGQPGGFGDALPLLLLMALMSCIFGALPGLLTGLFAAYAWPRLRGWRAHLLVGVIGAAMSAVCVGALIAWINSHRDAFREPGGWLGSCVLAGGVGAMLLSLALDRLRGR